MPVGPVGTSIGAALACCWPSVPPLGKSDASRRTCTSPPPSQLPPTRTAPLTPHAHVPPHPRHLLARLAGEAVVARAPRCRAPPGRGRTTRVGHGSAAERVGEGVSVGRLRGSTVSAVESEAGGRRPVRDWVWVVCVCVCHMHRSRGRGAVCGRQLKKCGAAAGESGTGRQGHQV